MKVKKVLVTQSCLTLCNTMDTACWAPLSMESSSKNTRVGSHALLLHVPRWPHLAHSTSLTAF